VLGPVAVTAAIPWLRTSVCTVRIHRGLVLVMAYACTAYHHGLCAWACADGEGQERGTQQPWLQQWQR
jgi:hypothetical protein